MASSVSIDVHPSLSDMDYSNPFFLHHGDSPGAILVSQPLTGDNYSSWRRAMIMALTAKNKLGFVTGTLPLPNVPESDPLNFSWCRCNNMVLSWLINSVSKEIAASIIYIDSAAENVDRSSGSIFSSQWSEGFFNCSRSYPLFLKRMTLSALILLL
jgi:hypothetical protein